MSETPVMADVAPSIIPIFSVANAALVETSLSVQFLPADVPTEATVRYRCYHLQEQLEVAGISSSVKLLRQPEALRLEANVLVLHRAGNTEARVEEIIRVARNRGNALVYGVDDMLFSTELTRQLSLHQAASSEAGSADRFYWEGMQEYVRAVRDALMACDCAVVTTEYLADRVRELGKPAYVVRNSLSVEMTQRSKSVRRDRSRTGGRVMLGYLSGTATHNYDFGEIAPVLATIMARHEETYLTVVGPMELPQCLKRFGTRIRRLPLVPWQDLPDLISDLDINLAPLDMLASFCHAKSEIKWMEAGAVGVPTVASATRGFAEAVRHGETGLLANTPQEWERALEDLVTQPELRRSLGEAARREVFARYTAEARAPETAAVFAEIAGKYARPVVGQVVVPALAGAPSSASSPAGRVAGRLARSAAQAGRNWKRLLSPFYWDRVLSRWETGRGG